MDTPDGGQGPTVDQLVEHVRQSVATGVPRDEAAARLAGLAPSRAVLEDVHVTWQQTMARLPSDDFPATDELRVIEAALDLVPRPLTEH